MKNKANFIRLFSKNLLLRLFFIILLLFPLFFVKSFYSHFYSYITGNVNTITSQWHIVLLNIVLFLLFLVPLSFRRKTNWAEYGLVSAFFVSLFIEMYGIPLTMLFASKYIFPSSSHTIIMSADSIVRFSFLNVDFSMDLAMLYGSILMIIGTLIIIFGWITLYKSMKNNNINISKRKQKINSKSEYSPYFITNGIYSYSRHPQYFGFILVIIGWLIGWPTIITLVFSPILIYKYVSVSKKEEREIILKDSSYKKYVNNVPFLI